MKPAIKLPYIDHRLMSGDLNDFITPNPEIERLAAYREKSQACIAFITYLEVLGCVIQPPKDYSFNLRTALCEFFGVNETVLQKEKLNLLGAPCQEKK